MANLRMTLGLSQEEFAVMLSISRSQLAMIEKGERYMDTKTRSLFSTLEAVVKKIPTGENADPSLVSHSAHFKFEKIDYDLAKQVLPYYQQKAQKFEEEIDRLKRAMSNLSQLLQMAKFVEKADWVASANQAIQEQKNQHVHLLRKKLKYEMLAAKATVMIEFYETHIAT